MDKAAVEKRESNRCLRLYRYDILHTPRERIFDHITCLAAELLGVKWSFISFLDAEQVFFKSVSHEDMPTYVDRSDSLCSYLLELNLNAPIEFSDLAKEHFKDRFAFIGDFDIHYFACAPLLTPDQYCIGFIGVVDKDSQHLPKGKLDKLTALSQTIMEILRLRQYGRKAMQEEQNWLNRTVHDIKNPLTSIRLYSQLIQREGGTDEKIKRMAARINESSDVLLKRLDELLASL
ncbi:histidine kinase dimerization/phospho-acceptor domain-containing protein [Olivibacter sitiensis]|uniref:sensor histidine kinase n=1 Tax=Olivibacter sitiensis TaxID=376470 RepID=UPI0003F5089D|nr:histidine kinase dimerization/phospho-acceptor domain-containing protein [Olivibacter sitiensis]